MTSSCLKSLLEMQILIGLLVVIGGALTTTQSGLNGALNKALEAPVLTGLVVAAGNLLVYGAAYAVVGLHVPTSERVNQVPWWAWFGGVLGGLYILSVILFAQKLGAAVFTGLTVTAGIITSVVLDHFGLAGFEQHSAGLWRILGCLAMIGGLTVVCAF